jgi:hypothetical protein
MKSKMIFTICLLGISTIIKSQIKVGDKLDYGSLKREDYVIMDNVQGTSHGGRPMFLFIGFGPKKWDKLHKKAYINALKNCGCDDIINPQYEHKRIPFTIILTTYVYRAVTLTGKGIRIKTDAEK